MLTVEDGKHSKFPLEIPQNVLHVFLQSSQIL